MKNFKLHILLSLLLAISYLFVFPTDALAVVKSLNGQTGMTQTFQNDTNLTISSSNNAHSFVWQGLLPLSRGGTGANSFTSGSLLFSNGTSITQDNSNLFWDDTNNRLGIGTSSPSSALDVAGNARVESLTSTADSSINSLTIGLGGGSIFTNTALGSQALLNNSIGSESVAVGFQALRSNNNGNRNVALGFRALGGNTGGSENVVVGWHSFLANLTGSGNVVIGRNAALTHSDGITNLTAAADSIYIGKNVRGFDNNDNNSIVIGADAISAGANKAVIGSSLITDVYFGSVAGLANIHAANITPSKLFLGSTITPGCIVMGDSDGSGVTYLTVNDGVLTASSTQPSACQ